MSIYVGNKKYCVTKKVGINNQDITITTGGRYVPSTGYTGFGVVDVETDSKTITPNFTTQVFNSSDEDLCGYDIVTINPITAELVVSLGDTDLEADNILSGKSILGVEGNIVLTNSYTATLSAANDQTINHIQPGGYKSIIIPRVTSAIDANIQPNNILKGKTILGVDGAIDYSEEKSVTLSTTQNQDITPSNGYNGLAKVTVPKVTSAIDANISAGNILNGVSILGVTGNVIELHGQSKTILTNGTYTPDTGYNGFTSVTVEVNTVNNTTLTVSPSTESQSFTPSGSYTGYGTVTVNPVTSAIDADITSANILKGKTILGVAGSIDYSEEKSVTPTTSQQIITPTTGEGYNGLSKVTVAGVTSSIDANIISSNIKDGVTILGVTGNVTELHGTTITASKNGQYTPSSGYNGYTSVTVSVPLESLTIDPNSLEEDYTNGAYTKSNGNYVKTHNNYGGYSSITIAPVTADVDPDIVAGNIKAGINILGVEGTYSPQLATTVITPTTSQQIIGPPENKDGYSAITVEAVTSAIDADIKAENILNNVNILGVTGKIVLDTTTVNPSTSSQTINHPKNSGVDGGYKSITVNPVTAAIDENIIAANILSGKTILGVAGSIDYSETKNVTPTTSQQVITPTSANGYCGLSSVTVAGVTSAIDADIIPSNILKGKNILGVDGSIDYSETKTVSPSTSSQTVVPTTTSGYCGLSSVTVNAVTSSIDANISAGNIKEGVTILGVEGTYGPDVRTLVVDPRVESQVFEPSDFDGYSKVTVNAVPSTIDIDISASNIRQGIDILGVEGTLVELVGETRSVSITSTSGNTFTPSSGKNGITSITVAPTNQAKTIAPSTTSQTINVPSGYSGFGTLTVNPVTAAIDSNIAAGNIKSGVTILGVSGTVTELKGEAKTGANKITTNGTYTPGTGFNGFTSVEVDVNTVNNTTLSVVTNGTYTAPSPYTGYSTVTVAVDTVNNTSLSITPTTSAQNFTPTGAYTGYGSITVSAVTSAIDSNITASNIKSGVTILGVEGTVTELKGQTKTINTVGTFTPDEGYNGFTSVTVDVNTVNNTTLNVTPTTSAQNFTPTSEYTGYGSVSVNAVTSAIDNNIVATNIKDGVTILGVTGSVVELKGQTKSVSITSTSGNTFTPDSNYNGITSIEVAPTNQAKTVTATTEQQTINVPSGYSGFGTLTVNAVTSAIDENIVAGNIKEGITILGVEGTLVPADNNLDLLITGNLKELESDVLTVRDYAFCYLAGLDSVTLNNATYIGYNAFANTGLKRLVLGANSVCQLNSSDTFTGTAIEGGTGYIFVPDGLVSSYKSATNWLAYASQIKGMSDYPSLFAWTNETYGTLYTDTETPSIGGDVFDAAGNLITSLTKNGHTITNISITGFDIDTRTITVSGTETVEGE